MDVSRTETSHYSYDFVRDRGRSDWGELALGTAITLN